MIKVKFFTYGTVFEEWLDPSDVRKLTEEESLRGLQGPTSPITQRDLEEPREEKRGRFDEFDRRNNVGSFGDGPRNRRQDREERRFRGKSYDEGKERDNWSWYQQNERRSRDGGYSDGEEHIRGSEDQSPSRRNFWAESDVDSQWGRRNTKQRPRESNQNRQSQRQDDWSSFISESSASSRRDPPTKEETDDFFSSLMSDLSNDLGDESTMSSSRKSISDGDDDDDELDVDEEEQPLELQHHHHRHNCWQRMFIPRYPDCVGVDASVSRRSDDKKSARDNDPSRNRVYSEDVTGMLSASVGQCWHNVQVLSSLTCVVFFYHVFQSLHKLQFSSRYAGPVFRHSVE